jgi:hypothetical protein
MIPHTTVEALLAKHGNTLEGRPKVRAHIRRQVLAAAEAEATVAGLSHACRNGHHFSATGPSGCRNDGSDCICECHDPKEGAS